MNRATRHLSPLKGLTLKCKALQAAVCLLLCMALSLPGFAAKRETNDADVDSYKFDFGAGLGMSGYLGDANESNLFKHPGVVGQLSFRYLASNRFAVRGILNFLTLKGNTADWNNVLPAQMQYDFSASVYDLGARAEFNFFPYGVGQTFKRLRRWTPYLTLGLGFCVASCDGNTSAAPTLPMGVGVKFKLSERWNLAAEFVMTKAFTDKIDGPDLSDPYGIKSSFLKNTDWYSSLSLSISYEFGPRCATCHRVD